ncbi:cytochrome P450 [Streptomyces griseocarneus]|uniref:cytochrome P450 n=1 Tax=Streptomyces griseocarneus TaxID=51201 RepID=UPI00167E2768|nr:cytochrome P450 [Streptomyces griseocarneus]MBZ6474177.1 cytochrome P450 [Streptomyces griseocarneus]GHG52424.1 biflaviolin synthase CYP158A2 [Streptomyces griseocarneus]
MTTTESVSDEFPVRFWNVEDLRGLDFDPFMARQLRDEPVSRVKLPNGEGHAWFVTRYEDVKFVTSDPRFSRQAVVGRPITRLAPHFIPLDEAVGFADPPEHTRLRKAVAKAFTARSLERLRPGAQRAADALLDEMEDEGPPADLMKHLHGPLPLAVISDLMGVPQEDRPRMAKWTNIQLSAGYGREASEEAKGAMASYFTELLRSRLEEPRDDLAGDLAEATRQDDLSTEEAVAIALLIQASAAHAVRNNSANMVYALLTHPEHLARLRAEPALLPQAIEELLRYIPHRNAVGLARVATEDVEVAGVRIRAGEVVHSSYLTANRDPAVFEHPDELDFNREHVPHLSFGHGPHFCLGSMLARLESEIILSSLIARFPKLRLAEPLEDIRWQRSALIRGPENLPVTW